MAIKKDYVSSLLEFLDNSPCNFLAVDSVKKILNANGFKEKKIDDELTAKAGEKTVECTVTVKAAGQLTKLNDKLNDYQWNTPDEE